MRVMARAAIFRWTEERTALLVRTYREEGLQVDQIADQLSQLAGVKVGPRVISRKVATLRLAKDRDPAMIKAQRSAVGIRAREKRRARDAARGLFTWTEERIALTTKLYLIDNLSGDQIARRLGHGCTARQVVALTSRLGLPSRRDPAVLVELRREILRENAPLGALATSRKWKAARAAGFTPSAQSSRRRPAPRPTGPVIDTDMRALIDAAVAAGKVTVLPAGTAAGLSQMERLFHAAPASGGLGWKAGQRSTAPMRRQAGA